MTRLYAALSNTLRGFAYAFKHEPAVREEAVVLLLALPLGAWLAPSAAWYVAMIGALLLVLAVELLNTAMEKLADHVAPERAAPRRPRRPGAPSHAPRRDRQ